MGPTIVATVGLVLDVLGVVLLSWAFLGIPPRKWPIKRAINRLIATGKTIEASEGPSWDDLKTEPTGEEREEQAALGWLGVLLAVIGFLLQIVAVWWQWALQSSSLYPPL